MRENYPVYKLRDLVSDKSEDSEQIASDVKAGSNVWFLRLKDIESHAGVLIHKNIVGSLADVTGSFDFFSPKCVLISRLRPNLNKVIIPASAGVANKEIIALYPVANEERPLDRNYLAYLLRSEKFLNDVSKSVTGTTLPRMNIQWLLEYRVALPPLEVQLKTVEILRECQIAVEASRNSIKKAEGLVDACYANNFLKGGINKDLWEKVELDEALSVEAGRTPKVSMVNTPRQPNEMGVLKVSAVSSGLFKESENKRITGGEIEKFLEVKKGELLFSRANTPELVGETCMVDSDITNMFLPDKIWRLKEKNNINKFYLFGLLKSKELRGAIKSRLSHSTQSMTNISLSNFKRIKFDLPPETLREKFAEDAEALIDMGSKFRLMEKELIEIRNSVSRRFFSGVMG
ncbi:restriction endonuclease subunit S [Gammaproteobacteria bacterium]|nr:restriction endonuclease subunit S [Gammaproteobacteria bacterium]